MLLHLTRLIVKIVLAIVLAVCAGYATYAASNIKIKSGGEETARNWLIVSSVIAWIFVVVTVLSFIANIIFVEEIEASHFLRLIIHSVIYMELGGLLLVGIFMAIAAQEIRNGPMYGSNKSVFQYASDGAIIGITVSVSFGLIFVAMHFYDMYKNKKSYDSRSNPLASDMTDFVFENVMNKYS